VTSFSGTPTSRAGRPAHRDLVHANLRAGALAQQFALRFEPAPDGRPDRAEAGQADAQDGVVVLTGRAKLTELPAKINGRKSSQCRARGIVIKNASIR